MSRPQDPKSTQRSKLKGLEEMADEGTADAKMQKVRKPRSVAGRGLLLLFRLICFPFAKLRSAPQRRTAPSFSELQSSQTLSLTARIMSQ